MSTSDPNTMAIPVIDSTRPSQMGALDTEPASSTSSLSPSASLTAVVVAPATVVVVAPVAATAADSLTVKENSSRSVEPSSLDSTHVTLHSPAGRACRRLTVSVTPSAPSSGAEIELNGLPSQTT